MNDFAAFDKGTPSPQDVNLLHKNSDCDRSAFAQHHTLGTKPSQAAPGNHTHNFVGLQLRSIFAQSIPNNAWTTLTQWVPDTNIDDSNDFQSFFGEWICKVGGIYEISLSVMFRNEISSSGIRGVGIWLSGSQIAGAYVAPIAAQADYVNASTKVVARVPAGQSVGGKALQNSGGAITVHTNPYTLMSIIRIGE